MSTDSIQAVKARLSGSRRRTPGQESQSDASVNHTLVLAREAARMADLAAELAADAAFRSSESKAPTPANDVSAWPKLPELPQRRLRLSPALPAAAMRWLDWVAVALTAQGAAWWTEGVYLDEVSLARGFVYVAAALFLKLGLWLTSAYRFRPAGFGPDHSLGGLAIGVVAGLIFANIAAPDARAAAAMATVLPVAALGLAALHAGLWAATAIAQRAGAFCETIAIIGATARTRGLIKALQADGVSRVVAVVDDRRAKSQRRAVGVRVLGSVDDLINWSSLPNIDRIVIALPPNAEARIAEIAEQARRAPNRVELALEVGAAGVITTRLSGRPHCHRRAFVKRVQDLMLGTLLLAAFAAPMLIIAIAVKLDGGPVLFRQRRHGFNNRPFTLLKFRTLNSMSQTPTHVGRLLRRTSLDELPQLLNVLRGDMSLVGPRPHRLDAAASGRAFGDIVADYAHRHRVKPGLTGLAQINGCRGAVRTAAALRKRLKLDLEYIENASLGLDARILARTAVIVLGDIGAALSGK